MFIGTHSLNGLQHTERNITKRVHTVTDVRDWNDSSHSITGELYRFHEQIYETASCWRTNTNKCKCCIARVIVTLSRTDTLQATLVHNLDSDLIFVQFLSGQIRHTAVFTTGKCFVLNG
jgi:hypothetical protein